MNYLRLENLFANSDYKIEGRLIALETLFMFNFLASEQEPRPDG
jgi:hypothetical protein